MSKKQLLFIVCIVVVIFIAIVLHKKNNKIENSDGDISDYNYEQKENGLYVLYDENGDEKGTFETEEAAQIQKEFLQANPGYEANPPLTQEYTPQITEEITTE